jgi:heme O synthase-like polyprenyltransferase
MENVRVPMMPWIRSTLLSRENLYAVLLCLAVILVIILTADQSPLWIYQGF